jgi:hypothetical protein
MEMIYYKNELVQTDSLTKYEQSNLLLKYCESSGYNFDAHTCDYNNYDNTYWLDSENEPDGIVWSEYESEWVDENYYTYCYYGNRNEQTYICNETETILQYRSQHYHESSFDSHELIDIDGELHHQENCVFCEDEQDYRHENDAYYCEVDGNYYANSNNMPVSHGLKSYHNSDYKNFTNLDTIYRIGFEVEKEDSNLKNFEEVREIGWDAEKDGSLNDNGFELVSPVFDLYNFEKFENNINQIENFLNADCSENCGGHINVSVLYKSNVEVFEMIKGYLPLIYAMYKKRVLDGRYSKGKKVDELNDGERYNAINFTKSNGILEFRLFSRVKNIEQLKFRYKFIAYMFSNHRKGSAGVISQLHKDNSELRKLLLQVYSPEKFEKLIKTVENFTDLFMNEKDYISVLKVLSHFEEKKKKNNNNDNSINLNQPNND